MAIAFSGREFQSAKMPLNANTKANVSFQTAIPGVSLSKTENIGRQWSLFSISKWLGYHTYTIWLFTFSDLKTIVGPSTVFGVVHAFTRLGNGYEKTVNREQMLWILVTLPRVLLWVWMNLLPFAIDNQRQPPAIEEDSMNKPWRAMPSKRLTTSQATRVMYCLYPAAVALSLCIGGAYQALSLIVLGYWYNNLNGADASCITRNFINACGFVCFTSGAFEVAVGQPLHLNPWMFQWLGIIFTTVFSTVQTQDMCVQAGDQKRGRKTVPLEFGDAPARFTIALPMVILCWVCPWFCSVSPVAYVIPVTLGTIVALRTLTRRDVQADKTTFRIWNLWMVSLYFLPALSVRPNA